MSNRSTQKPLAKLFANASVKDTRREDFDMATAQMIKVRSGDVQAFEWLYNEFKGSVSTYLYSFLRDPAAVEELAQEAFLRVYRNRETYEPQAKFSTWLWTIARNLAFDRMREKEERISKKGIPIDQQASDESPIFQLEDTSSGGAEVELIERSEQVEIEDCLAKIPSRQKEVLLMRTVSELTYEEIAKVTELQLGAVKSLIHRAKLSLTECLATKKKGGGAHE